MWTTSNLLWLDLSYNYLVNIEDEILKLPKLQTLYLQCNFIKNLEETRKLAQL
jgi:Leucine-rich repeat (LRR) protein